LKEATTAYEEAARSDDPAGALAEFLGVRPLTAAGRAQMTAPAQSSGRVRRPSPTQRGRSKNCSTC